MSKKTKELAINSMMAAMCAVLGYVALDMGSLKVTFESLPILLSALLFGPASGMVVGGMGTLIYQLLRYGVSATTALWMLPYIVCGLIVGWYAKRHDFTLTNMQIMGIVIINELLITILNTGVIYVDSKIYGYYTAALIVGSLVPRLLICVGKAVAFGLVLPGVIRAVHHNVIDYMK
ncbi:MAG: ECF transporter S component [Firmicutes bacterium]|nr:ECF transporter S component [Bacillota bacterium]